MDMQSSIVPSEAESALLKILLFSDLHLDSQFGVLGPPAARKRRQGLQTVLQNICARARGLNVDAVLCGGDLYEHDRFSPQTVGLVRSAFESLRPIPVFLAPGNHDWYGPESLYARAGLSDNVHIFTEPRLTPVELADGLTLWGAAHQAPANTDGFLEDFHVERSGVNIALFHGSEQRYFSSFGEGKTPHAPFQQEDIAQSGLNHAFLGHYHKPSDKPLFTYPGNPDPLSFGEDGERGIVIIDLASDASMERTWEVVAVSQVADIELDVSGCSTVHDIHETIAQAVEPLEGYVRVTLQGELTSEVDFHFADVETPSHLEILTVRGSSTLRIAYDFEAVATEPTVRGQFVRDVRERADLTSEERRAVLVTGLRALEGREDLEVY